MGIPALSDLRIKLYADGADLAAIRQLAADPLVTGLTTNPSLMKKAGVPDYLDFARAVLAATAKPVSFEVTAEDDPGMIRQALLLHGLGPNVYVKIPITNSAGLSTRPVVAALSSQGVKVNVTAVMNLPQVAAIASVLLPAVPAVVSIFAGRIADTGRDPQPTMQAARDLLEVHDLKKCELLWASTREVDNLRQAQDCGCHIITMPPDILAKARQCYGMGTDELSLLTVQMFARDAAAAGYQF